MDASGAIGGLAQRATSAVALVVRDAAARTGVDFGYLMAQARVESGLNPTAKARTSSATGLYQFTNATWIETVRKHGAEHGLGWAADAIASGVATAGSAARATILALREDAGAAALMAGEFAADNAAVLERRLGRAVGATDLYMAHFLGAGGAVKFLKALGDSPGVAAAGLLPAAAAANRAVFYGAGGTARSVGEVYARFAGKLGVSSGEGPLAPLAARVALSREGSGEELPLSPLNAAVGDAFASTALSRPLPQPEATPSRQRERGRGLPVSVAALPVEASRARMAYMLLAELGA